MWHFSHYYHKYITFCLFRDKGTKKLTIFQSQLSGPLEEEKISNPPPPFVKRKNSISPLPYQITGPLLQLLMVTPQAYPPNFQVLVLTTLQIHSCIPPDLSETQGCWGWLPSQQTSQLTMSEHGYIYMYVCYFYFILVDYLNRFPPNTRPSSVKHTDMLSGVYNTVWPQKLMFIMYNFISYSFNHSFFSWNIYLLIT